MKTAKAFCAGALVAAAGILAGFSAARPDGYPVDGRVESMTPQHLQRAISMLGLDARGFTYESPKEHVLRVDVEDYVDGKLDKTELLIRTEIPHIGKQSFMVFSDTRDQKHIGLSSAFITSTGSSHSAHAWLEMPKLRNIVWNDKATLKVGEKAPLFYCFDQGHKSYSMPLPPVEKMAAEFTRVIVVYATLESEK